MTAPYQQPGADVAFWMLFGLFSVGEYAMRLRSSVNRSGERVERWSLVVVIVGIVGGLAGGFMLAKWNAAEIGGGRWVLFVVGLGLMAAGVFVRQWAILTLGRYFTVDVRVRRGQTVIDRGPYRWVRHLSYTGLIVFCVGLGLALSNWASLIVLAALPIAGLLARIRSEERALHAKLGEQYGRFASTRRRLFPGIW